MTPEPPSAVDYDAVVIGSGFGGAMTAHRLVNAGLRVLMLERGGWATRGDPARDDVRGFFQWTSAYSRESAYRVRHRGRWGEEGICACVGGPSVFYGGASFRFREGDFDSSGGVGRSSGMGWPIDYAELEPYYGEAERLLGVAGEAAMDPTEPFRSSGYPQEPAPLSPISARLADAARRLDLHPFRIPLALNHSADAGEVCTFCTTCDAYACWNGSKNDLATRVIEPLLRRGLTLLCGRVVVRLDADDGEVRAVECVNDETGELERYSARSVVLAAGALATPHLLLTSGLERFNPAADAVGRYLMRHCNAFVYGFYPRPPNPEMLHHKQVAINDFYFGDEGRDAPVGKLGNIQQIMAPQTGAAVRWMSGLGRWAGLAERIVAGSVRRLTRHMSGLQVIAEDEPVADNRVRLGTGTDRYGLRRAEIHHSYTDRDLAARRALVARAREILKESGAVATFPYSVTTFSHAVGTVRMGSDPRHAPLDESCRFRGLRNLWITDGSFMPTSAALNPSLTIAANALRVSGTIGAGRE